LAAPILDAITSPQRMLFPNVQLSLMMSGSIKSLNIESIKIVTTPNPSETSNSKSVFNWAIPNGLKRNRNRKINIPNTRIKTTFSLVVSILL
jgi:hypothetical protein